MTRLSPYRGIVALGGVAVFASPAVHAEEAMPHEAPGAAAASPAGSLETTVDELPPVSDSPVIEAPSGALRTSVILSGLLVTGGFYGVSFASSFAWQEWQGAEASRIPVIGPFLALGKVTCGYANPNYDPNVPSDVEANPVSLLEPACDTGDEVFRAILAGVSAVGQLGGLALIAEGFWMPTAEPVSSGAYSRARVAASPLITPTTIGLSFTGAF